jgi:drug/metabolite transporter (DMT)-like permease
LIFGILAVSGASIFVRYAQVEASSLVIAAYRLGLATIILAPILYVRHRHELRNLAREDLLLGLLSGVFLAIHFATWITSLEFTTVASSVVLVTTAPLWVAILSPVLLKESINRKIAFGLVIATAGTVIVGMSDVCNVTESLSCPPLSDFFEGKAIFGDLLALVGAWAAAGYVIIGRNLRSKLTLIPYIFIAYGTAAVILVGLMFGSGHQKFGFSSEIYLWLILLAVVPQLLGHSTFNWALGYLPAAFVAIALLGEPIGSTILAYFLLSEVPTLLTLFGAILILAGILIASQNDTSDDEEY